MATSISYFDKLFVGSQLPCGLIKKVLDKLNIIINFSPKHERYYLECQTCESHVSDEYLYNLNGELAMYGRDNFTKYPMDGYHDISFYDTCQLITEAILHFIDKHSDSYVDLHNNSNWGQILKEFESLKQTLTQDSNTIRAQGARMSTDLTASANLSQSTKLDVVTNLHDKLKSIMEMKQLKEKYESMISKLKEDHNKTIEELKLGHTLELNKLLNDWTSRYKEFDSKYQQTIASEVKLHCTINELHASYIAKIENVSRENKERNDNIFSNLEEILFRMGNMDKMTNDTIEDLIILINIGVDELLLTKKILTVTQEDLRNLQTEYDKIQIARSKLEIETIAYDKKKIEHENRLLLQKEDEPSSQLKGKLLILEGEHMKLKGEYNKLYIDAQRERNEYSKKISDLSEENEVLRQQNKRLESEILINKLVSNTETPSGKIVCPGVVDIDYSNFY